MPEDIQAFEALLQKYQWSPYHSNPKLLTPEDAVRTFTLLPYRHVDSDLPYGFVRNIPDPVFSAYDWFRNHHHMLLQCRAMAFTAFQRTNENSLRSTFKEIPHTFEPHCFDCVFGKHNAPDP